MSKPNLRSVDLSSGQYQRGVDFGPSDLVFYLSQLGLTGAGLADEIGVPANTVSRWRTGEHPIPGPVIAYLKLRLKVSRVIKDLA